MKLLQLSTFAFLFGLAALEAHAAPLTFYTYSVSAESLPCNSANCPSNASINLQGTITTDGLGTLAASDIVVWNLAIALSGQTPIRLTQNNGQFSTFGSSQILATSSDLTMTRSTSSDGFSFGGSVNAPASWFYGIGQPAQVLSYNTDANTQYTAQQTLTTPSTFTASLLSATETPEPASLFLVLIAGFAWLGIAKFRTENRLLARVTCPLTKPRL
jgi:hypothetical protein